MWAACGEASFGVPTYHVAGIYAIDVACLLRGGAASRMHALGVRSQGLRSCKSSIGRSDGARGELLSDTEARTLMLLDVPRDLLGEGGPLEIENSSPANILIGNFQSSDRHKAGQFYPTEPQQ